MPLFYTNQYFSTSLSSAGGINNSQTTGIILQSVSGVDITKPGIICLTFSDPLNTTNAEYITYTSINGSNELVGATRGAEGFAAKPHSEGSAVAFILSETHINQYASMFDTTGLDIAEISTPTSPIAGRNKLYFKSDDKLYKLTSGGTESEIGGSTLTSARITASAATNFTTTQVDITGATTTFSLSGSRTCLVTANFDFTVGVANDVLLGYIVINGSNSSPAVFGSSSTANRSSVTTNTVVTLPSGSNTIKIAAIRTSGSGTGTAQSTTGFSYIYF